MRKAHNRGPAEGDEMTDGVSLVYSEMDELVAHLNAFTELFEDFPLGDLPGVVTDSFEAVDPTLTEVASDFEERWVTTRAVLAMNCRIVAKYIDSARGIVEKFDYTTGN